MNIHRHSHFHPRARARPYPRLILTPSPFHPHPYSHHHPRLILTPSPFHPHPYSHHHPHLIIVLILTLSSFSFSSSFSSLSSSSSSSSSSSHLHPHPHHLIIVLISIIILTGAHVSQIPSCQPNIIRHSMMTSASRRVASGRAPPPLGDRRAGRHYSHKQIHTGIDHALQPVVVRPNRWHDRPLTHKNTGGGHLCRLGPGTLGTVSLTRSCA